ncbi:MAG: divalent cation transporter [Oceanospirillaceae bacterium]
MTAILTVTLLSFLAGVAMPIGALIARFEHIRADWLEQEFRHGIMAFGAGALLSAVALVLVPQGIANLTPLWASIYFIAGGFGFMALDILLFKLNTPASQLAAMLTDFIPESIALGATFILHRESALLLAVLIGLQNIPEGFNAYRELRSSGHYQTKKIILLFLAMAFMGPIAAVIGLVFLADATDGISALMLFAAGGILYSIFQDIAPKVSLEMHWLPPMGAILGFVLGMLGSMLVG